ncbi:putative integral membrane protein [Catenulispora acidiphila DSM 44928]|uniref:Putative integral membrane protein n=1 Tax=Catenulispora acidiphila (strain DSM 44928 / JCM 14897 / NBRC 102108 / NRRL B-24433 / ID139908) TaxID=479433 RepID=C7Q3G6_CATAD|nr:integral membrane protein [Catenulispora acidiphila]ACU75731.1 putative integral membrane protein [Catenulispora acidiphila DSM 44928]
MDNVTLFFTVVGALLMLIAGGALLFLAYRPPASSESWAGWLARLDPRPVLVQRRKLAVAIGVGCVVGVLSGWPVAAAAIGLAMWFAPIVMGHDVHEADRTARVEAVAVWAEMLRDVLSSAAGLEQAVLASTTVAPEAIAGPLAALGSDLRARRPFADAMRALAAQLGDATADQVIVSLIHAQKFQAKNLAELLGELAAAARAQVSLAVRVHAERAKHRTSQRAITVIFTLMALGLCVFYPKFLRPYDTVGGQMVMAVVVAMFAGALCWIQIILRPKAMPRLLDPNGWEEA